MIFCIGFIYYFFYTSVFINQKCSADNTHILLAKHLLLAPYTIIIYNFLVLVCYKWKRQVELFFKLFMAFYIISTYANYYKARFYKRSIIITQVAGLCSTAGCIVFRVKIKDY